MVRDVQLQHTQLRFFMAEGDFGSFRLIFIGMISADDINASIRQMPRDTVADAAIGTRDKGDFGCVHKRTPRGKMASYSETQLPYHPIHNMDMKRRQGIVDRTI